jgi:futalosine hydrolase
MNLLIVSATGFEIAPLLKAIQAPETKEKIYPIRYKQHTITILLTGVGIAHTAFYLGKYLTDKYDLVINAGICGSFIYSILIGDVLRIDADCFADIGAEDDEVFLSIKDMNLPGTYDVQNEHPFNHAALNSLKPAKGATVNTTHGNTQSIHAFLKHTRADVESMEGAAFLFACNEVKVPCVQVRAVSNYVEKRDRSKWNIPLAIENLNAVLLNLVNQEPV